MHYKCLYLFYIESCISKWLVIKFTLNNSVYGTRYWTLNKFSEIGPQQIGVERCVRWMIPVLIRCCGQVAIFLKHLQVSWSKYNKLKKYIIVLYNFELVFQISILSFGEPKEAIIFTMESEVMTIQLKDLSFSCKHLNFLLALKRSRRCDQDAGFITKKCMLAYMHTMGFKIRRLVRKVVTNLYIYLLCSHLHLANLREVREINKSVQSIIIIQRRSTYESQETHKCSKCLLDWMTRITHFTQVLQKKNLSEVNMNDLKKLEISGSFIGSKYTSNQ